MWKLLFYSACIPSSPRFPANYLLDWKQLVFYLQFDIFTSLYTHCTSPQKRRCIQFVLFVSFITGRIYYFYLFSSATWFPFLFLSWTERCFHRKKEIFSRTFLWMNLAVTENSYRNRREKFSQYMGKFLANGVNKTLNLQYYR